MNLSVNGDEFHDDDDGVPRTGRRTSPNPTAGDATDEHGRPVAVTTARVRVVSPCWLMEARTPYLSRASSGTCSVSFVRVDAVHVQEAHAVPAA